MGQVAELGLRPLQRSDIREGGDVIGERALGITHHAEAFPGREDLAVLAPAIDLALPLTAGGILQPGIERVAVAPGMQHLFGILPYDLLGAITGNGGESRVDGNDAARLVHNEDTLTGGLEHRRGLLQPPLDLAAFGDVLQDPDHALRRGGGGAVCPGMGFDPADFSAVTQDAESQVERLISRTRLLQHRAQRVAIVRVDTRQKSAPGCSEGLSCGAEHGGKVSAHVHAITASLPLPDAEMRGVQRQALALLTALHPLLGVVARERDDDRGMELRISAGLDQIAEGQGRLRAC